jgi:hypothetical protein
MEMMEEQEEVGEWRIWEDVMLEDWRRVMMEEGGRGAAAQCGTGIGLVYLGRVRGVESVTRSHVTKKAWKKKGAVEACMKKKSVCEIWFKNAEIHATHRIQQ